MKDTPLKPAVPAKSRGVWNPWDVRPKFNSAAQQQHLKAWIAKALNLLQRAAAGYSLSTEEFVIGAPIAAELLLRAGSLLLANSPALRGLERLCQFSAGNDDSVTGVALGHYRDGSNMRAVVLASRDEFDRPPLASDPSLPDQIFLDGLTPPPARTLTPGRFAAVHLGLCRLVEHATLHIETPSSFSFCSPTPPHSLQTDARAILAYARGQHAAVDADWDTSVPTNEPLVEVTIIRPPRKMRAFKRCRFCKKPLGERFSFHAYVERVVRRRSGEEREVDVRRERPFHEQCWVNFTIDRGQS